jgi:hypothetical protein
VMTPISICPARLQELGETQRVVTWQNYVTLTPHTPLAA